VMYDQGQGVPKDYAESARWYRLAADQGDAMAQFNLGVQYAAGQGVERDFIQSHIWVNLATARATGDQEKKFAEFRDTVAQRMTNEQIAEAQRKAREWTPNAAK